MTELCRPVVSPYIKIAMISLPVIMNELIIIKYYVIYFTDTFLADDITLHIIMVRIAYKITNFDYKGDAYYDIKCQKVTQHLQKHSCIQCSGNQWCNELKF